MKKEINALLGFDFGTKSLGIAVGQMVTKSARPVCTLRMQNKKDNASKILKLIKDYHIQALVVGLPLAMDESDLSVTELAKDFATELGLQTGLPVYLQDERLTSTEIKEELFELFGYKGLTKENIDAGAACLILEAWMNAQ